MRPVIYPHSLKSGGARLLAKALNTKRLRNEGSKYRPSNRDLVINWGSSKLPIWARNYPYIKWLNHPDAVVRSTNKLHCFKHLSAAGVWTVPFTHNKALAQRWIDDGATVVVRGILNGSGGAGISLVKGALELPDAPLYTKFIRNKAEYRVHVFNGAVIDVVQKKKKKDFEGKFVKEIRNHDNGWVYCRKDIVVPQGIRLEAIRACAALGLDFGAVDIIFRDGPFVLEVNTAPGLEGTTIGSYTKAIGEYVKII